jgi:hypothetical protein
MIRRARREGPIRVDHRQKSEASPATKRLIESHARQNPAFTSRLEAAGAVSLSAIAHDGPSGDLELQTLRKARQFIFLRRAARHDPRFALA